MMLWIILTLMTSVAAVLVAAPFLRRLDDRRTQQAREIMVYRDQLSEIERETRDGVIDADQAGAARVEIERRMLAADRRTFADPKPAATGQRNGAMLGVTAVVVLGSVGLYAINGRPDLPSAATASGSDAVARLAALTRSEIPSGRERGDRPAQLATVDEMIDRVVQRLKQQPGDPEGWRMLGWSYFGTERYGQAAEAYAKAVALSPNMPLLQSSYGEAMVRAADGQVTPQARTIFDVALKLDPKDPRARFFKGLAKEQDGAKAEALNDWIAILADAGPDEPWASDLEQRVAELAREIGVDIPARLRQARKPATGGVLGLLENQSRAGLADPPAHAMRAAERGPTAEDVRKSEGMAPSDRTAMIRGMVDSLASRLKQSPLDADGWIKLIRSHMVLGEASAARAALGQSLQAFRDLPHEQSRIEAVAREMGVTP